MGLIVPLGIVWTTLMRCPNYMVIQNLLNNWKNLMVKLRIRNLSIGDLGKYIIEFGFGGIYSRAGLTLFERELVAIAMLTVLGGKELELRFHISAALKAGLTLEQIEEIIIQSVLYADFPTAINALIVLNEKP